MAIPAGWFPTALNAVLSKLAAKGVKAQAVGSLAPADLVTRQVKELDELNGPAKLYGETPYQPYCHVVVCLVW